MAKCKNDTRDSSEVIFSPIDEKQYKAELELLDRFHIFSAELLRLSLIGIAVFGFLYEKLFSRIDERFPHLNFFLSPKWASGISVLLFSISAAIALAHRYFSTDAAGFYVHSLRIEFKLLELQKNNNEEALQKKSLLEDELKCWMKRRGKWLTICSWLKFFSALLLALGALLMGYAFFRLLIMQVAPFIKP